MPEKRLGILIANQIYDDDSGFLSLTCPANDVAALRDVLTDPQHGEFDDVRILQDESRRDILMALEETFQSAGRDDLVLVYFSGHGKLDRRGNLFFAARNTSSTRLRSTGINASDMRELILESPVRKKALILDCCYAGAFMPRNFKSSIDVMQDRVNEFSQGSGTYVLMATDELSLAEEDPDAGISVFTKHLIDGLRGEADANRDGYITLTELSNYVQEQVVNEHSQKPIEAGLEKRDEIAISKSNLGLSPEILARIRKTLLEWSEAKAITDTILGDALSTLAGMREQRLSPLDCDKCKLLARIDSEDLGSAEFLLDWFRLTAMPPEPEPPKPKLKPKPATPEPKAKAETKRPAEGFVSQPATPTSKGSATVTPGAYQGLLPTLGWLVFGIVAGFVIGFSFYDADFPFGRYYSSYSERSYRQDENSMFGFGIAFLIMGFVGLRNLGANRNKYGVLALRLTKLCTALFLLGGVGLVALAFASL